MFRCLSCGNSTTLPTCWQCGHTFEAVDGIYQLTEDPGINLDDDKGTKYVGYDRVGSYYGGRNWLECDPASMAIGSKVAELVGRGLVLDLGCGDGRLAVPVALHGCTVVAGDISNVMLKLALEKAAKARLDATRLIPCRMNALSIPLANDSVDGAMANGILHLISEPSIVIRELWRVLKPGGKLFIVGNSPGLPQEVAEELRELNREYEMRVNEFHNRYWEILKEAGVRATRYSWEFDQYSGCESIFGNHTEVRVDFNEQTTGKMADYFMYRMGGKGFSDQQGVPDDLHEKAFAQVVREFSEKYGPDFDQITYVSITDGLVLHLFEKVEGIVSQEEKESHS